MIVRTWSGRVPIDKANGFYRHLLETGVADYQNAIGCCSIKLMKCEDERWAHFMLFSIWECEEAMAAFAGPKQHNAVLYSGDETFELIPDKTVNVYQLLPLFHADPHCKEFNDD